MAATIVGAGTLGARRAVAVTASGRIWVVRTNGADSDRAVLYSSDDKGATWSASSESFPAASAGTAPPVLFVDLDDHLYVLAWGVASSGSRVGVRRYSNASGTLSGAIDSAAVAAHGAVTWTDADMVVHRSGSDWTCHVLFAEGTGSDTRRIRYSRSVVSSSAFGAWSPTGNAANLAGGTTSGVARCSLDFNHTGDGKTVASSTPHLFGAYTTNEGTTDVAFRRASFSSGSWSWGTARGMTGSSNPSVAADGTRVVVGASTTTTVYVRERDIADTTWTTLSPTALSDGDVDGLSASVYGGQIQLVAVGATSDDPKYLLFDRGAGTWGSWTAFEATTVAGGRLAAARVGLSDGVPVAYETTAPAIRSDLIVYNDLPLAPPITEPATDRGIDRNADLTISWTHTDPNGDPQTAYKLRRRIDGGAWEWWNGTTWTTDTGNTTAAQTVTLTAPIGTVADVHEYQVATSDAEDFGPYSTSRTLTMGEKVNPTITTPAVDAVVATSELSVLGSVAESSAYRWRILLSSVPVYSTGKVSGTLPTEAAVLPFDLANDTAYTVELTTWSLLDVESTAVSHAFTVAFTVGPTPTFTVTATDDESIVVVITNPAPVDPEPDLVSQDVWVRVAAGGRPDLDRPVGGDGISPDRFRGLAGGVTIADYPASGTNTEYRVRASFDNGTSVWTAWAG